MMPDLIPSFGGPLWTAASFILALSVIVFVHEYGHYIVGRWSGIRAEVFSVGFGPRLLARRDRRGTLWQFAAIPLGGYVRFLGDADVASAGPGRPVDPAQRRQTLTGAPLPARFATLLAGPVFNFLLSIAIFAGFALVQGLPADDTRIGTVEPSPPGVANDLRTGDRIVAIAGRPVATWADLPRIAGEIAAAPVQTWTVERDGARIEVTASDPMPPRVTGIQPRSPAADVNLLPGAVILSANGQPLSRFTELRPIVEAAAGRPVLLETWHPDTGPMDYTIVAREQDFPVEGGGYEKRWLLGLSGGAGYAAPATRAAGPIEALSLGIGQTAAIVTGSLSGMWAMVTGQIGACNLGGAISIAETMGQAASAGLGDFLWWIAVLSAAVGFLNLLPIPVLDGGHLMFYAYEGITGRPPSDRALNIATSIGLAAVLALMVFGLTNDFLCR